MQKIVPHLWFDNNAVEATKLYTSIFPNSEILNTSVLRDTPSGDAEMTNFMIMGYEFMAISGGPYFKPNPSISFMINFDPSQDAEARSHMDKAWEALIDGGKVLMPLDSYDFSEHYGWVEDKYGFSWQLILTKPEGEERPLVLPSFMFVGDMAGKAREATDFYMSIFNNSKRGALVPYPQSFEQEKDGNLMFTDFTLEDQWFVAMDSSMEAHDFSFNEAVSLIVRCDDQGEIDTFWDALSAVPESEQCGWLKDKYGVSWQITPTILGELMGTDDEAKRDRVTQAFLKMKKFNIDELKKVAQ